MPLPAHLRVRMVFRDPASGFEAGCVLYYTLTTGSPPTVDQGTDLANAFKTAYSTATPAVLTTAHRFNRVEVVYTGGGAQIDAASNSTEVAGGVAGDVLPEEDCVVIQRRTGLQGRDKRGRLFVPFVPEVFTAGSTLTDAAFSAYQQFAAMVKNQVTATLDGDISEWAAVQPSFKANTFTPITQARVYSEVVNRQDRRFVKRGFARASV